MVAALGEGGDMMTCGDGEGSDGEEAMMNNNDEQTKLTMNSGDNRGGFVVMDASGNKICESNGDYGGNRSDGNGRTLNHE